MADHSDELTSRPALPSAALKTSGSGLAARILRSPLAWLLLLVCAVHGFMFAREPEPNLFEDEPHYAQAAFSDAALEDTSLLPGRLRFAQRPEFGSRLLSKFVVKSDLEDLWNPRFPESLSLSARMKRLGFRNRGASLERRIRWLNLALMLALVAMTHKQARLLGMGPRAALVGAASLGLFPWFGFYVTPFGQRCCMPAYSPLRFWRLAYT